MNQLIGYVEVFDVPFVEISMGGGAFTTEEKEILSKAVYNTVIECYRKAKGVTPHCWVVIREEPPETWVIDGETLTEVRRKAAGGK
jgi:phenylpyruvate tautomerase PptA (4-oxalocrotonate tautomerase family)